MLIADGACCIRSFFTNMLSEVQQKTMSLGWQHLKQKCVDLSSRTCRSKLCKARFLWRLARRLWRGDVLAALELLEEYRSETKKNEAKPDELIVCLRARGGGIPNYRQRRSERPYIGADT